MTTRGFSGCVLKLENPVCVGLHGVGAVHLRRFACDERRRERPLRDPVEDPRGEGGLEEVSDPHVPGPRGPGKLAQDAKAKAFFRRTFVLASSGSILKLCQPLTALFSCANQEEVDPKMYAMLNRVEQVVSANKIMIEDADRKIEALLRMQAMKAHGPMKHDVRDAVALATSNRVDMDLDMKKVRLQVATRRHLQLPDVVTGSCCRSHRVTPAAAKSCSTSLHEPAAEALCVAGEGPVGQAFEGEEARAAREGVPAGRCC